MAAADYHFHESWRLAKAADAKRTHVSLSLLRQPLRRYSSHPYGGPQVPTSRKPTTQQLKTSGVLLKMEVGIRKGAWQRA